MKQSKPGLALAVCNVEIKEDRIRGDEILLDVIFILKSQHYTKRLCFPKPNFKISSC